MFFPYFCLYRLTQVLFRVQIVYFLMWMPLMMLILLHQATDISYVWYVLVLLSAHGNSAINCLVYGASIDHFREGYKKLLCCGKRRNKRQGRQNQANCLSGLLRRSKKNRLVAGDAVGLQKQKRATGGTEKKEETRLVFLRTIHMLDEGKLRVPKGSNPKEMTVWVRQSYVPNLGERSTVYARFAYDLSWTVGHKCTQSLFSCVWCMHEHYRMVRNLLSNRSSNSYRSPPAVVKWKAVSIGMSWLVLWPRTFLTLRGKS